MPTLTLPTQLSSLADGQRKHTFSASSLHELFDQLSALAPLVRSQVLEADGSIRRFVGLFVDGKQVKSLAEGPRLSDNSTVIVVMAVAGG